MAYRASVPELTTFTPVCGLGHEGIQREPGIPRNVKRRHSKCGKSLVGFVPTGALYTPSHVHKYTYVDHVCVCACVRVCMCVCVSVYVCVGIYK